MSLKIGERRAARALPIFQEFRILQEVNNLKVQVGSEQERPLKEQEREAALKRLRSGKDIDFRKPTRDLKLPSDVSFNLARGGRQKIKGDETTARLIKKELFGSRWQSISIEERNEIVKFLLNTEDPETVQRKARKEWGLTELQVKAVAAVSLPTGYGDLSEKAIDKILPHLDRGLFYSDAIRDAGYSHHSDFRSSAALDRLPYYGELLQRDAVGADPTKDPQKGRGVGPLWTLPQSHRSHRIEPTTPRRKPPDRSLRQTRGDNGRTGPRPEI